MLCIHRGECPVRIQSTVENTDSHLQTHLNGTPQFWQELGAYQSVSSRESHNIQISQTHPIIKHTAKMIHTYRQNNQRQDIWVQLIDEQSSAVNEGKKGTYWHSWIIICPSTKIPYMQWVVMQNIKQRLLQSLPIQKVSWHTKASEGRQGIQTQG
jgi:hypothetical protein